MVFTVTQPRSVGKSGLTVTGSEGSWRVYIAPARERSVMPLYMDRHDVPGATAEDVAGAHMSDLRVAGEYDVKFFSYWFDPEDGSVFCFARAPDPEAMTAVHQKSHGLLPAEIIEVSEQEVVDFLGKVQDPSDATEIESPFRLIAFTDLVDSTVLLNRLGEAEFMVLLTEHDLMLRKALVRFRGREVKHTGDGIMASFDEASACLEWALDVRDTFRGRADMEMKVGLSAGEPVDHNRDLFGAAVNLASRICGAAGAGQVLVSDVVRDLGIPHEFRFDDGEKRALKGFTEPQLIYELIGLPG